MSLISTHQLFVKQGNICPFTSTCMNGVCCIGECIKPLSQKYYEKVYYLSQCKHRTHECNSDRLIHLDIKIFYCNLCRLQICSYCEHELDHQKEQHELKLSICQNTTHKIELKKLPVEDIFQLYIIDCI